MPILKTSYESTFNFSKLILDYLSGDRKLDPFFNRTPSIDSFKQQILEKSRHVIDRGLLVSELKEQNRNLTLSESSANNIKLLKITNS